ncbi:hypothetical protein Tco_1536649 [Tanacetum coccineum]
MASWQSQREDHTSDWLRVVPISGLGRMARLTVLLCVTGDIYRDHAVSCAGIIGIKHRHNAVRDTLVDICFWSGISAGKEVDIGLVEVVTKPYVLRICYFIYGMERLMWEFEVDSVTLLKRIRKFFMAQDIGARAAIHIFNRISFAIAKGVGAQIVSRLPSNLL